MAEKKGLFKNKIFCIFLAVILLTVSFFCGFFVRGRIKKDEIALNQAVRYLKKYGVFNSETLELRSLTDEEAVEILVNNLSDDYAAYYSPEDYKILNANNSGNYSGIGITVTINNCEVHNVTINSPAFNAGIQKGDIIKGGECDGKSAEFNSFSDMSAFFSEIEKDKEITLKFSRDGEDKTATVSRTDFIATYVSYCDSERQMFFLGDKPKVTEVDGGNALLSDDTAYISLSQFEGNCGREFGDAINFMLEHGRTKLILDLRDNGGGQLNLLTDVASFLINNNKKSSSVIVSSKDNKGNFTDYSTKTNRFDDRIKAISVIANENTASASECLIGAMLYYKDCFDIDSLIIENAELIESAHTYGKGIMQTTYNLTNGGGIKLTTAVVYQPDKTTCIHGKGITVSGENALSVLEKKAIFCANEILKSK